MASAAAVRTDSSRSCKSGTSAGTDGAAAFLRAPSARAADTLTAGTRVVQQVHQCGHRGHVFAADLAQGLGRLAAHLFVRLLQQTDQSWGDRRRVRTDSAQCQCRLGPHGRRRRLPRQTRASPRPARSGRGAVTGLVAFSTRQTARSLGPGRRCAPATAAMSPRGARAGTAQGAQRCDDALPHHVAGVADKRGQCGYRLHGVEVAQRGDDDRPHIIVRVAEMTDQGRYDRRADRFQDQRDLVPLLFGQRS